MATLTHHDLSHAIGDCGRFQGILVGLIYWVYLNAVWGMQFMTFGLYNPGWTCLDDAHPDNSTVQKGTIAPKIPLKMSSNITEWSKDCSVREMCRNIMYNPDSSTMVTEWNLTCGASWISSVIISVLMTGVLFGAYTTGQIGDKFGRKFSVFGSVMVQAISQLAAAFVGSWQMYTVFMFFIGVGAGGILSSSFHYPMEFVSAWWRGTLASVPMWTIGCAMFTLVAFVLKDWRSIHITAAVISALILPCALWTPESVRWLAVSGKVSKAKAVVGKIAHMNGRPCPDTQVIDDIANEEKLQMGSHKYGYLDLFRNRTIRGYSIKFGVVWIVMAVTYYVISFGMKSLSGNFYLNMFLFSVLDFPLVLIVAPLLTKLGRRITTLLYFGVASACSLSVVVVIFTASGVVKDVSVLALAIVCKAVALGAWYAIKVYESELYPTVIRSLHFGYVNSVARIGGILSPYILSNDPETLYIPFLVIGLLTLLVCGIICTLPETKGKSLQERVECQTVEVEPFQGKIDQVG